MAKKFVQKLKCVSKMFYAKILELINYNNNYIFSCLKYNVIVTYTNITSLEWVSLSK